MSQLQYIRIPPLPEWHLIAAGTALFAAGLLARGLFLKTHKAGIIQSPRATLLPSLSKEQQLKLPYPPDALPGARDVETPYGTFRVYEWGPEDGRKVLLIHGISTPCLTLGGVAHGLADKGCRVMLFDLPGRGYSDTPTDVEHDVRLFTTQILLVLASSPLSWTAASGGFALVGYSLGGGISASFASYFSEMVNSLILICPAGLIRDHHISRASRILYSKGVIPEPILNRMVRTRLKKPLYPSKEQPPADEKAGAAKAVSAEINLESNEQSVLSKSHPDITIDIVVNHQIDTHEGFVQAFMSSIRYGPIRNEHDRWRRIGRRLTEKNKASQNKEKVLIILGVRDPIIAHDEIKQDASDVLEDNVTFEVLSAGHDAPVVQSETVSNLIWNHWKQGSK